MHWETPKTLQLWDTTKACNLHEKEKENKPSLAWPPESEALNSLVPPLNSAPLLEKLLISTYQSHHRSAPNVWLNQNKNTRRHVSQCGFDFYFVVMMHMSSGVSHLDTLFSEIPAHIFCQFCNWIALFFFLLKLKISFHILCTSHLSVRGWHIFPPFL